MTFRDRLNAIADRVRRTPVALDERPTTVRIRTRTWAGGRRGSDGPTTDTDVTLTPTPKVREVNQRDIAASAGRYILGDVKVGPITPTYPGGGYTMEQLAPTITEGGIEIIYVLAGGVEGEYARVDLATDRTHSWFLTLRRRRTTP